MNQMTLTKNPTKDWKAIVPMELQSLFDKPPVLQIERRADYDAFLCSVVTYVLPRNVVEWMWTKDYVDLTWEIRRYRFAKASILDVAHGDALESLSKAVEPLSGGVPGLGFASRWFGGDAGKQEVRQFLAKHGIMEDAMIGQALLRRATDLEKIEAMLASAEARRNSVMKEIALHREFAKRFHDLSDDIVEGEFTEAPPLSPPADSKAHA